MTLYEAVKNIHDAIEDLKHAFIELLIELKRWRYKMNDHDEIMHILKRLEYVEKKIEALADGICNKCMSRGEDEECYLDSNGYKCYKSLCSECPLEEALNK